MTDFEDRLRGRLLEATREIEPAGDLLVEGERRFRRKLRTRRTAVAGGLAAAVTVAAVGVGALMSRPDSRPFIDDVTPRPSPSEPGEPAPSPDPAEGLGSWQVLMAGPLAPRAGHVMVWTGTEAIVWGGGSWEYDSNRLTTAVEHVDGAAYDPERGAWRSIADAPEPRLGHTGLWTGSELIVVGGAKASPPAMEGIPLTSLRYDPVTDTWRETAPFPLEPRWGASIAWTGSEVIVWGGSTADFWGESTGVQCDGQGSCRVTTVADGAAYDPASDSWRILAPSPLRDRADHGSVWNGRRLVVFGGGATDQPYEGEFFWTTELHDAASYDPATDTWTSIQSPPEVGPLVSTVWTGNRIVYWSGRVELFPEFGLNSVGAIWDPATGAYEELQAPPFTERRDGTVTVWAGDRMVFWGGSIGEGGNHLFDEGAALDPSPGVWTALAPAPLGHRSGHAMVWTGTALLVWGGTENDPGGLDWDETNDGAAWYLPLKGPPPADGG